jgi:hypothetical protein
MTLAIQDPITRDPGPMTLAIRWPHDPGENADPWPHGPGDRHFRVDSNPRAGGGSRGFRVDSNPRGRFQRFQRGVQSEKHEPESSSSTTRPGRTVEDQQRWRLPARRWQRNVPLVGLGGRVTSLLIVSCDGQGAPRARRPTCLLLADRAGQAAAAKGKCGGKAPSGNICLISRARSRSRITPARKASTKAR